MENPGAGNRTARLEGLVKEARREAEQSRSTASALEKELGSRVSSLAAEAEELRLRLRTQQREADVIRVKETREAELGFRPGKSVGSSSEAKLAHYQRSAKDARVEAGRFERKIWDITLTLTLTLTFW